MSKSEEGEAYDTEDESAENNQDPDKQSQIFLSQHRLWSFVPLSHENLESLIYIYTHTLVSEIKERLVQRYVRGIRSMLFHVIFISALDRTRAIFMSLLINFNHSSVA